MREDQSSKDKIRLSHFWDGEIFDQDMDMDMGQGRDGLGEEVNARCAGDGAPNPREKRKWGFSSLRSFKWGNVPIRYECDFENVTL